MEGSFEVKFLGGSDFIAQFKIAMDVTVTVTTDSPSANGIQMDMHYHIAGNIVYVNFDNAPSSTSAHLGSEPWALALTTSSRRKILPSTTPLSTLQLLCLADLTKEP